MEQTWISRIRKQLVNHWPLYVMVMPALLYTVLFNYKPMYGVVIAFKKYSLKKGILGSPWVGLANFERVFSTYWFPIILKNTFAQKQRIGVDMSPHAVRVKFQLAVVLPDTVAVFVRQRFVDVKANARAAFALRAPSCTPLDLFAKQSSGFFAAFLRRNAHM